jgi:hypothetical protein
MTGNMVLEFTHGRMVASMRAIGTMESSMMRGSTASQMEWSARVDGKRASGSPGSTNRKTDM